MNKTIKWGLIICLAITTFMPTRFIQSAQDYSMVISEIMYDPLDADDKKEWIELVNISDRPLILTSTTKYKEKYILPVRTCTKLDVNNKCLTSFPVYFEQAEIEISPEELIIISNDVEQFQTDYPDFDGQIFESKFSLGNKSEDNLIGLYETDPITKETEWGDKLFYQSSWGGSGDGHSLEKKDFDQPNEKSNWFSSQILGGTPGEPRQDKEIQYSDQLRINEVLPDPAAEDQEAIEIVNLDEEAVSLAGWSLQDRSGKQFVIKSGIIDAGGYGVFYADETKISLNNDGDDISLYNPKAELVDKVVYPVASQVGWSWSRNKSGQFSWTEQVTLGKENQFPVFFEYPRGIVFNEILNNPKGSDKGNEWIELRNKNNFSIDLTGWKIENKSQKKYVIDNAKIKASGLIQIKFEGSFSLANQEEDLKLFSPDGILQDEVQIKETASDGASYNYDSARSWQWSHFLTPGKKNHLNSAPKIKAKLEKAYKGYSFEVDASASFDKDKDKLKFKWDFGDGKYSYLSQVKHVYTEKGIYKVMLNLSDSSQTMQKKWTVKVKDFPSYKLKIRRLAPNPIGNDEGNEIVEIENLENQDLDLKGYKIATGKDQDSLANHILPSLIIKAGQKLVIKNDIVRFSLGNAQATVALKTPADQILDEVSYAKEKIEEAEEYAFQNGNWNWIMNIEQTPTQDSHSNDLTDQAMATDSMAKYNPTMNEQTQKQSNELDNVESNGEDLPKSEDGPIINEIPENIQVQGAFNEKEENLSVWQKIKSQCSNWIKRIWE